MDNQTRKTATNKSIIKPAKLPANTQKQMRGVVFAGAKDELFRLVIESFRNFITLEELKNREGVMLGWLLSSLVVVAFRLG